MQEYVCVVPKDMQEYTPVWFSKKINFLCALKSKVSWEYVFNQEL